MVETGFETSITGLEIEDGTNSSRFDAGSDSNSDWSSKQQRRASNGRRDGNVYWGFGIAQRLESRCRDDERIQCLANHLHFIEPDEYPRRRMACKWNILGLGNESLLNQVYPLLYEDNETHIFVRWSITKEGGRVGCFNTNCQGFIQTSVNVIAGAMVDNFVSDLNGTQYSTAFSVLRDDTGNWWVSNDNELMGYFPRGLLPDLDSGAATMAFGGRLLDKWNQNRHTYTEMGSGFFPLAGYGFAAFQFNLTVTDSNHVMTPLFGEELSRLKFDNVGECYYTFVEKRTGRLFFGGSGYNPRCQKLQP